MTKANVSEKRYDRNSIQNSNNNDPAQTTKIMIIKMKTNLDITYFKLMKIDTSYSWLLSNKRNRRLKILLIPLF